jgi:hypothetical protein
MGAKALKDEWKAFLKANPGFAKNKDFKNTLTNMAVFDKYCGYWAKAESNATKYAPLAQTGWEKALASMKAFEAKLPAGAQKTSFAAFLKSCEDMDDTMKDAFDARKDYDPKAKAARTRSGADAGA